MSLDDDDMDRLLRTWGRQAVRTVELREDELPLGPVELRREPPRSSRRAFGPLVAASMVCGLAVLAVVLFAVSRPAAPVADGVRGLIVRNGATVRVSGQVVASPGAPVKICQRVLLEQYRTVSTSVPCPVHLTLTGVDLTRLAQRHVFRGTIRGFATLTGTYRDGRLDVHDQTEYHPQVRLFHDHVPCEAPSGGWPQVPPVANIDMRPAFAYKRGHSATTVYLAVLRPSRTQAVAYVLTTADPATVRKALANEFPKGLCVQRSAFTKSQIARAVRTTRDRAIGGPGQPLTSASDTGPVLTKSGQLAVLVRVPLLTERLADAIDIRPVGLMKVSVWVRPVD